MSKLLSNKEYFYVALGDSLANGVGAAGHGYPQQLQQLLQKHNQTTLYLSAVSGQTSTQLLQRRGDFINKLKQADLITVNIGGNDLRLTWRLYGNKLTPKTLQSKRMQLAVTTLVNNWNELAKLIVANKNGQAKVIFLNLYNPYQKKYPTTRSFVNEANGALQTICSNHGIDLLDVRHLLNQASKQESNTRQSILSSDNLHLSQQSYEIIAQALYRHVYPETVWDRIKKYFKRFST